MGCLPLNNAEIVVRTPKAELAETAADEFAAAGRGRLILKAAPRGAAVSFVTKEISAVNMSYDVNFRGDPNGAGLSLRLNPAYEMHLVFGPRVRAGMHERYPVKLHGGRPEVGALLRQRLGVIL